LSTAAARMPAANLLPLADGWYQYDFTRTFRDIEAEQAFERVNYRVAERYFNERTRTAFVLLEMRLD